MAITLEELLMTVEPGAERLARDAYKRHSPLIRETLRSITGLKFGSDSQDHERAEGAHVPVIFDPGFPEALRSVEFPDDWATAIALAEHRNDLKHIAQQFPKLVATLKIVGEWPSAQNLLLGRDRHLRPTHSLAQDLLRFLLTHDPVHNILSVNEDVLGCYQFMGTRPARAIRLYWGVIALTAKWLAVNPQDLCTVVFTHEQAHALTHYGADIEGDRWDDEIFRISDALLIEGLAQYYTHAALHRLSHRHPNLLSTFQSLLRYQPQPYHEHRRWLDYGLEDVRRALIELRASRSPLIGDFLEILEACRSRKRLD